MIRKKNRGGLDVSLNQWIARMPDKMAEAHLKLAARTIRSAPQGSKLNIEGGNKMKFVWCAVLVCLVFAGCRTQPTDSSLPDRAITPGDALDISVELVCTPGHAKGMRSISASAKAAVYAAYGRREEEGVCCEVDHLIPLELGGSNRISNLWPQPYAGDWNARRKDRLEAKLHRLVCSGAVDLKSAQREIASDWIAAYQRYISR